MERPPLLYVFSSLETVAPLIVACYTSDQFQFVRHCRENLPYVARSTDTVQMYVYDDIPMLSCCAASRQLASARIAADYHAAAATTVYIVIDERDQSVYHRHYSWSVD